MWAGDCKYFILVLLDCSTAAFDTAYEQVFWYLRIYTGSHPICQTGSLKEQEYCEAFHRVQSSAPSFFLRLHAAVILDQAKKHGHVVTFLFFICQNQSM